MDAGQQDGSQTKHYDQAWDATQAYAWGNSEYRRLRGKIGPGADDGSVYDESAGNIRATANVRTAADIRAEANVGAAAHAMPTVHVQSTAKDVPPADARQSDEAVPSAHTGPKSREPAASS